MHPDATQRSPVECGPTAGEKTWQRCMASLGCPELTLAGIAELANEFEVELLELRAIEDRVDLPAVLASQPGGWDGARRFLGERSLATRVLGTSFKLVGNNDAQWKELLDFAALAEILQAPYLRAFGGGTWGVPLTDDDYSHAAATLERWETERASKHWNVRLLVETHDAFSASDPFLRLRERTSAPLELIWDTHHTWRLGGESPEYSWEKLGPLTRHVHFKDSVAIPSARHPYTYVIPGEGEMPIREMLALLGQNRFTGGISLEWEKMWHPYLPPLSSALEAARALGW